MSVSNPPAVSRILGYAVKNNSDFSTTNTFSSYAAVTGLSTTVTVGDYPLKITMSFAALENSAGARIALAIKEDSNIIVAPVFDTPATAKQYAVTYVCRRAASAGQHTYAVYICAASASTTYVRAQTNLGGVSGANYDNTLLVEEMVS